MSAELKNPKLPAHAIVEVHDDGRAWRNDGILLDGVRKNPWYILATIFGEQRMRVDPILAAQNRRAWNGWFCKGLASEVRESLANEVGVEVGELADLTESELAEIERRFMRRIGSDISLPSQLATCDFVACIFNMPLNFDRFIFGNVDFSSSIFKDDIKFRFSYFFGSAVFRSTDIRKKADFSSAKFRLEAVFDSTHFGGPAFFGEHSSGEYGAFKPTHFGGAADFSSCSFSRFSDFHSSHFCGPANFSYTCFSGIPLFSSYQFSSLAFSVDTSRTTSPLKGAADFSSATFSWAADFRSASFQSTTKFDDAVFQTAVPQFEAANLYDSTTFTLPDDFRENWPPLVGVGVMPAAEQKRAYNRLRLFMNKTLQIEEEQFFHRQEMRCKMVDAPWYHLPIYKIFEVLSDFGGSLMRPLLALLAVIVVGAVLMELNILFAFSGECASKSQSLGILPEAMGWSFGNTFSIFGFGKTYYSSPCYRDELSAWFKFLAGFQTVSGFILLFLLGLSLRNRFRLR